MQKTLTLTVVLLVLAAWAVFVARDLTTRQGDLDPFRTTMLCEVAGLSLGQHLEKFGPIPRQVGCVVRWAVGEDFAVLPHPYAYLEGEYIDGDPLDPDVERYLSDFMVRIEFFAMDPGLVEPPSVTAAAVRAQRDSLRWLIDHGSLPPDAQARAEAHLSTPNWFLEGMENASPRVRELIRFLEMGPIARLHQAEKQGDDDLVPLTLEHRPADLRCVCCEPYPGEMQRIPATRPPYESKFHNELVGHALSYALLFNAMVLRTDSSFCDDLAPEPGEGDPARDPTSLEAGASRRCAPLDTQLSAIAYDHYIGLLPPSEQWRREAVPG